MRPRLQRSRLFKLLDEIWQPAATVHSFFGWKHYSVNGVHTARVQVLPALDPCDLCLESFFVGGKDSSFNIQVSRCKWGGRLSFENCALKL